MKKKISVLALACAMAVSAASFSAYAENTYTDTEEVNVPFEVTAEFALPAVDVTFPTSLVAAINPYHLNITSDGWTTGTSGITSPEYEIKNNSDEVGVMVYAKLSAFGSSDVNIVAVDGTGNAPVFRNDGTEQKLVFAFLNTTTERGIYANSNYTVGDSSQLAFTETAPDKAVRLMQIGKSSSGFFKIQGDVVETPETSWSAGDSVTFNIVFDTNPCYIGTDDENTAPADDTDDTAEENTASAADTADTAEENTVPAADTDDTAEDMAEEQ